MKETSNTNPITLTPRAIDSACALQKDNRDYANKSLRLYLDGKGCDGFYYGVTFDDANPTDTHFQNGVIDLVVDPDTLEFVLGSTIDWVDDERGKGFLVDNPNHKKFRGKFYKRTSWQEKLAAKKAASQTTQTTPQDNSTETQN